MIRLIKSTFYREKNTKEWLCEFIKDANQLSFGKECLEFERNFAKWQGRKHCVFVNSGSSANLALIQALLNLGQLKAEDTVGFSALTWSTNVMPIIQLGLEPFPIDVSLTTLNVSPLKLAEVLNVVKLKAVFLTNLLGLCDNIDVIRKMCDDRGVILLEDNCESLGSVYQGEKLGNFGLASTFSFYVGHHMSTIEGGAICTDDPQLADMLRIVRAHGWDRNLPTPKVNPSFYSRYTFYDLAYNLRPTEIQGYLGNMQLDYLDEIVRKREHNFERLKALWVNDKYHFLSTSHMEHVSSFAMPLICKDGIRESLVERCQDKVEIRPIVAGDITQQPFYRKYIGDRVHLPNTKMIHENGLYFPNNPELTDDELERLEEIFG